MKTRATPLLILYNLYFWLVCGSVTLVSAMLISLLPGLKLRRKAAKFMSLAVLRLAGNRVKITGADLLPAGNCIVVSNHASYLDGVVLTAVLPPHFGFVIKREVTKVPIMHLLLRRLGSEFVDRFDPNGGRADASRIMRKATDGHALGVFAEGTFARDPGLRPFRMGAFLTACRANLPIAATVIQGTRNALPAGSW
ncbi:MAG: 1-acyl-sn-glycerol-3-phosphate acyltransferase, partial [Gammaproteobacteria bacterium]|nr:1-acyl-sn-glycerol-3-phosphate acyltransferase [Gammaproteobacteria bacterium]